MNTETLTPRIGIIGGSGLRRLLALTDVRRQAFETPFGAPSDEVVLGQLNGVPVAFLQRHGQGHRIAPSDINVRANIAALRRAGCTQLLSLSAVGSLDEECAPGTFVLVDQFIDRTVRRTGTFFGPDWWVTCLSATRCARACTQRWASSPRSWRCPTAVPVPMS